MFSNFSPKDSVFWQQRRKNWLNILYVHSYIFLAEYYYVERERGEVKFVEDDFSHSSSQLKDINVLAFKGRPIDVVAIRRMLVRVSTYEDLSCNILGILDKNRF